VILILFDYSFLTTREGESQHAKLESVERNIRENLRVMHDLEVILADHAFNQ